MKRAVADIALAALALSAAGAAQTPQPLTRAVRGVVFMVGDNGQRAVLPGTTIFLNGPTHIEVQSDDEGNFAFYSVITGDQYRDFVGPRNELRFPRFVSTDLQAWREIRLPIKEKPARVGFGVFDVFNHANYRDVQNDLESYRFGEF